MPRPRLTFFCELDAGPLQALFSEPVIADLVSLDARISMGLRDLSAERAEVVRRLNRAGVPVIAWLLLPEDQGYWFNLFNAEQAAARYREFKFWTDENGLVWSSVGLDFEPDLREVRQWGENKWRLLPQMIKRALSDRPLKSGLGIYQKLVGDIRSDGYLAESYQLFFIRDERQAGSSLLQRVFGLVNVPVDQEIWMLYTSIMRPNGAGILWSYAPESQAIGLGSTGGGIETQLTDTHPLDWEELARDLRLSWYWSDDLYIFSLEGCVHQDFLERLKNFTWDQPILFPDEAAEKVKSWRSALRTALWLTAHAKILLAGLASALLLFLRIRRMRDRRPEEQ